MAFGGIKCHMSTPLHLGVDEFLDVPQPPHVLLNSATCQTSKLSNNSNLATNLLLLELCILWDKHRKVLIEAAFLHELLKLLLNSNIQVVKVGTNVQSAPTPVCIGSQLRAKQCIRVVRDVVQDKPAVLAHRVNIDGSFAIILCKQ